MALTLATQYQLDGQPVSVGLASPTRSPDGIHYVAVIIAPNIADVRIAGDDDVNACLCALQFATTHLELLRRDGRIGLRPEAATAVAAWEKARSGA